MRLLLCIDCRPCSTANRITRPACLIHCKRVMMHHDSFSLRSICFVIHSRTSCTHRSALTGRRNTDSCHNIDVVLCAGEYSRIASGIHQHVLIYWQWKQRLILRPWLRGAWLVHHAQYRPDHRTDTVLEGCLQRNPEAW